MREIIVSYVLRIRVYDKVQNYRPDSCSSIAC